MKNAFTRFRVPFYSFCVFNVRSTLSIIVRGCLNSRSGRTLSVERPLFSTLHLTWKETVLKLKGRRSLGPWQLLWKKTSPREEGKVTAMRWSTGPQKGIIIRFLESAHLPLPWVNIKTCFTLRAKCWLRGGEGGQFHKNILYLYYSHRPRADNRDKSKFIMHQSLLANH